MFVALDLYYIRCPAQMQIPIFGSCEVSTALEDNFHRNFEQAILHRSPACVLSSSLVGGHPHKIGDRHVFQVGNTCRACKYSIRIESLPQRRGQTALNTSFPSNTPELSKQTCLRNP
jgi:hypothetical protein